MTLSITNVHPVNLTCTISSSGALELHHGAHALGHHGNSLFNELPRAGAHEQAEVTIADFTHGGETHQVHAWEATTAGGVQKWTRRGAASSSGAHRSYGRGRTSSSSPSRRRLRSLSPPPPTARPPLAPPTSTIRIKTRPQGSLPF
jgi:hypothetical protein